MRKILFLMLVVAVSLCISNAQVSISGNVQIGPSTTNVNTATNVSGGTADVITLTNTGATRLGSSGQTQIDASGNIRMGAGGSSSSDVGLSRSAAGVMSVDGSTAGDGLGEVKAGAVAAGVKSIAPNIAVSVIDYGAIGDGATDNTAAFTAMESSLLTSFYLPKGFYKTSQSYLYKHYWGPGVIVGGSGNANDSFPGLMSTEENQRRTNLDGVNSLSGFGITTVAIIGDSITWGYNPSDTPANNVAHSYPFHLQKIMNDKFGGIGQGSYLSGSNMERLSTTGTTSYGTNGPVSESLILQAGATASFTADNVNTVWLYYMQQSSGGTLAISPTPDAGGSLSTAGTSSQEMKQATAWTWATYTTGQTFTLTCSGGPCEITGIVALNSAYSGQQINFQVHAHSGYATTQFATSAALNSIKTQMMSQSAWGAGICMLALGTNNIYNSGYATTSAQFKADLTTMINTLATTCYPVLTVPLRAAPTSSYQPILEPFDNYRDVVYQLARYYKLQVVDFSELDLGYLSQSSGRGYQGDGLHPDKYGYNLVADWVGQKLGLSRTGGLAQSARAYNLAGGALGSIPYQSSANATVFLAPNTSTTPCVIRETGTGSSGQAPVCDSAPAISAANMSNFPKVVLSSNYTNSTITPSALMSWSVAANTNYVLSCDLSYASSATTGGITLQLTGPPSPTNVWAYSLQSYQTGSPAWNDAFAYSVSITTTNTVASTAQNYIVHVGGSLMNGSNAGTLALQAATYGSGTLTINAGSFCTLQ